MQLGIFLTIGSSFQDMKKSGQDKRFVNYYLKKYNQKFKNVYIFSYHKEKYSLPENCQLIGNKYRLHRFLYTFLMPFIHWKKIKKTDVFRVMQMTGAVPAVLSKLFFRKPFIVTYGYAYVQFAKLENQKIRAFLIKLARGFILKQAHKVIVTTRQIKEQLKKKYPKSNIVYIPNGINTSHFKFSPITPSKRWSSSGRNHKSQITKVFFVGRLEKQKNLKNLIKAVAKVKDEYKIKLLFIGRGSQKDKLVELAEKMGVSLRIIDNVPHNEIAEYYRSADVFCLLSLKEGHPKVLLEAMACGLPCLVSKKEWALEFRDKKEVLKTAVGVSDIVEKLKMLIRNKRLQEVLSKNARKKVVKDYNINKLLKKEIFILQKVMN